MKGYIRTDQSLVVGYPDPMLCPNYPQFKIETETATVQRSLTHEAFLFQVAFACPLFHLSVR